MPPLLAPSRLHLKPWDKKLRIKFEEVPANATDESLWYGPWDMAIHRLFKDGEGFQITPQHLRAGHHGEPEWTIFYLIHAGTIPICVVEIKPYCDLKRPQARVSAYCQVEKRLKVLVINDHPIPTMYGVSVIGEQFLIMTMKTCTGVITPALTNNPDPDLTEITPVVLWRNQVLKRSGFRRLMEMVTNIKDLCKDFPPAVPADISLISEEEDSDTSSLSFKE
ncbi:hypothetical protein K439DRAFT_1625368 [Ramaria rubella]|nr:hypothetical protein K439DRAFT_1625368 [Ramaria rubella]